MNAMKALVMGVFFSLWQVQAADSVVLDVKHMPNSVYRTETKTSLTNEFNLKASKETIEQFEASGVKLPLKVMQEQTITNTLKTSGVKGNGDMPFSGTIETAAKVESSAKPGAQSSQKHFEVSGAYKGGALTIEHVKGEGVTPEIEGAVKQALTKVMESVTYPKDPIKVGNSFSQDVPVSIPMQGAAPVEMVMSTRYTLKSIKDKKAHFDIQQEYALAPGSKQSNVTLSGSGSGTMVYDAAVHQVTSTVTKSTMNMSVKTGEILSIVKTVTDSSINTTVSKAK